MTVQGGGGGRKIPPGPPSAPTTRPTPEKQASADKVDKAAPTKAASASPPPTKDGFETLRTDPRRGAERSLPSLDAASPSGVASMIRVLEDTRAQILDEHRALRDTINHLVGELAARGFERAALEEHRSELTALRNRMAALRRRLQQIQRRLRAAARGRAADVDVGTQLAPHLDRLRSLEPGLQRAMLALQMVELVCVEPWSGQSVTVGGDDASAAGDELARALPGAVIARGVAAFLASAEGAPTDVVDDAAVSPADDAGAASRDPAIARIAAIRDAIKASL